jgi:hypothetical protein
MNIEMSPEREKYKHQNLFGLERQPAFFLLLWFILNIVQVSFTELTSDEGYYWFYAQHLQWGYYDHPPMIAAMIKAGSVLFPGELGVRFLNVLFSTAGLYLFFRLLPKEYPGNNKTYFVLLAAPLLHYLTFIVFPDGPLLFFSLLFLFLYKRFLQKQTWATSLLMGISLALMAYSKYHGVLVLLFTIMANPGLLRSGYFYLSLAVAAIFFVPHIGWQYQNGFPTISYHLSGRTGSLSFKHVGEYISQQVFAIGPGLIFLPFVIKTKDVFERTLKFIIIGTFLFFLFSSFKTFVHFHWTSIALFPLLYFAVAYYNDPTKRRLFNGLLVPFVVIFFMARVLLLIPFIPDMHVGEDYYHGREQWAKEIAAVAGTRYVFMPNNLREVSLYSFYSGKQGVTFYNRPEKKSQYELWGYEDSLQGKDVAFVSKYPFAGSKALPNSLQQNLNYALLPSFTSYYTGISIVAAIIHVQQDSLEAEVEIINHRSTLLALGKGLNGEPASLMISFERGRNIIQTFVLSTLDSADVIAPKNSLRRQGKMFVKDLPRGRYTVFTGIRNGVLPDAILSEGMDITIK